MRYTSCASAAAEPAEAPAEEPAAEPAAEEPAQEPALEPDPDVVVTDGSEKITIGSADEEDIDPVQQASNLFIGENVTSQRLTSSQDMFDDLQKVANVLTDVVVGAYVEVTFLPGEKDKYLEIIPKDNKKSDGDRMFYLILGAPQGSTTNSSACGCAFTILDGEIVYRYDVSVAGLAEDGASATSAQIFLDYDPAVLALRKAEGAFDWTVNDQSGKISAVWASDTAQPVNNGDEILTLYFAKIGDAEKTDITFTENTLGNGSTMAFVIKDQIVELNAGTTDGSITFEAILYGDANVDGVITAADAAIILRSLVGLSTLSKRGALNAEVDGDGDVSAADAAAILRYVVGLIDIFPAQQP